MLKTPDIGTKSLLELADFFETLDPKKYNQSIFHHGDCRCICGWENFRKGKSEGDMQAACDSLGISGAIGHDLFRSTGGAKVQHTWLGDFFGTCPSVPPTPKEAASCLRHLAVTGELPADW